MIASGFNNRTISDVLRPVVLGLVLGGMSNGKRKRASMLLVSSDSNC